MGRCKCPQIQTLNFSTIFVNRKIQKFHLFILLRALSSDILAVAEMLRQMEIFQEVSFPKSTCLNL